MSLFWPYYGSLKGFQSNPCRLAATKSADAFDVQGTVIGKPIRTEIGSGIFSSGSVQNGSEPFSSKMLHKQKKDI